MIFESFGYLEIWGAGFVFGTGVYFARAISDLLALIVDTLRKG